MALEPHGGDGGIISPIFITGNIQLRCERFPQLVGMDLQSSVGQPAFKNVREAFRSQLGSVALVDNRIVAAPAGRAP